MVQPSRPRSWVERGRHRSIDTSVPGLGHAPGRIRTFDLALRRRALYPLSYGRSTGQCTDSLVAAVALLLYDNPVSSNALKVRFMLAEVGLGYERRTVPFDLPRPSWYLAVNPVGGIPALDDGGIVLAESHAILRYLAARERRDDLYPADLRARATVDEFLDRWALTFRPAFFRHESPALGFVLGKGMLGGDPRPDELPAVVAAITPTLRLLDEILDPSGFALGRFTVADVAAAPILFRTTKTGLDLAPYTNISLWRETVLARPSFAAAGPVS